MMPRHRVLVGSTFKQWRTIIVQPINNVSYVINLKLDLGIFGANKVNKTYSYIPYLDTSASTKAREAF